MREDIPTGITSRGRAETDADVQLKVTGGFTGEPWAVVEWTFNRSA